MGQRANLIIIEHNQRQIYYDHWAANRLDEYAFWGASFLVPYIRSHRLMDEQALLDKVWAEGGVVLDLDNKALLFWGGEDTLYDIDQRNLLLRLMASTWRGWQVSWAYEGQNDILRSIGEPPETYEIDDIELQPVLPDECRFLVSTRQNDGVSYYCFDSGMIDIMLITSDFLESKAALTAYQPRTVGRRAGVSESVMDGGIHLDCDNKTLYFWFCSPRKEYAAWFEAHWPSWQVVCLWDDYTRHFSLLNHAYFERRSAEQIKEGLRCLLYSGATDPLDSAVGIVRRLEEHGYNVQVSEWIAETASFNLPLAIRRSILEPLLAEAELNE